MKTFEEFVRFENYNIQRPPTQETLRKRSLREAKRHQEQDLLKKIQAHVRSLSQQTSISIAEKRMATLIEMLAELVVNRRAEHER